MDRSCGEFRPNASGASALLAATTKQTNMQFCINNWIGVLGTASTRVWNTASMGKLCSLLNGHLTLKFLGGTAEGSSNHLHRCRHIFGFRHIYLQTEALSFSDDMYYNSVMDKDLKIGFNDYVVTRFAQVQKKNSINVSTYISAGSIDHVLGTAVLPQSVPKPMVAYGSLGTGAAEANVANRFKYLSDPVTYDSNASSTASENIYGDGFYSTLAMQRCLQHLETSQFSINNKALNYAPLNKYEVFQNNLNALGYEGVLMPL